MPPVNRIGVPRAIVDTLARLEGKGAALPAQALARVTAP
jgi:hypothetical protein